MENYVKFLVEKLKQKKETISVMESCTGGALANAITNVEGASNVFSFGVVTYSNEAKIKFGVSRTTIERYSVYSKETAKEMSEAIAKFAGSTYGVGVTGMLGTVDPQNPQESNNIVYVGIFNSKTNESAVFSFMPNKGYSRRGKKTQIIDKIVAFLLKML